MSGKHEFDSDKALDRLLAASLSREAERLGSQPGLAERIALEAASLPQQRPQQRPGRVTRHSGLRGWLEGQLGVELPGFVLWPGAAALAASMVLGFIAGSSDLSSLGVEVNLFPDPIEAFDTANSNLYDPAYLEETL
jgi:hypothetical protein